MIAWLVTWKLRLILSGVLIAALVGGAWYVKRLYDSRLLATHVAEAWQRAAVGWSEQYETERAYAQELEVLRTEAQRERDVLRSRFTELRNDRARTARDDPDVEAFTRQEIPETLETEMRRLEARAGLREPPE